MSYAGGKTLDWFLWVLYVEQDEWMVWPNASQLHI